MPTIARHFKPAHRPRGQIIDNAEVLSELYHAEEHGCWRNREPVATSNMATIREVIAAIESDVLAALDAEIRAAAVENVGGST